MHVSGVVWGAVCGGEMGTCRPRVGRVECTHACTCDPSWLVKPGATSGTLLPSDPRGVSVYPRPLLAGTALSPGEPSVPPFVTRKKLGTRSSDVCPGEGAAAQAPLPRLPLSTRSRGAPFEESARWCRGRLSRKIVSSHKWLRGWDRAWSPVRLDSHLDGDSKTYPW